jgi:uncharacterized repeat protein (TIGR01451 family)
MSINRRFLLPSRTLLSILALSLLADAALGQRTWQLESLPEVEGQAIATTDALALGAFEGVARTEDGRIQVLVELLDPPGAVVYAEAMKGAARTDRSARALAGARAAEQVSKVRVAQGRMAVALAGPKIGARELYRVQKTLNGIAVAIDPRNLGALQALRGVKRVLPILAETPTNSTSVPFLGTPNVWANTIGLPAGADGTGIRIGIIDTGIDYLHPNFGGPGAGATNYSNERTDTSTYTTVGTPGIEGPFPTTKVVGGADFAGDAYTGANAPVPDVNPMDCNGHGSHVAGSAAGFGMTVGGATFTGPYDEFPATYSPLLIGPGTAPQALLYGLRVFGCAGSTGLTTLAIDWAMDPNGDDDLSDHLDIINMSLGSNFGSAINASSVSSDNAALAGVIVVASAGNASDTFFISGAPGAGTRVIATAASVDSGVTAPFVRINSPTSLGSGYIGGTAAFGPPLTPTGTTGNVVLSVDPTVLGGTCLASVPPGTTPGPLSTDACCPLTNAAAMAGNICLVDRGTCGFAVKAKNCQDAGAIATIVANNAPGSTPPGMAGVDPTIVTPSTSITLVDANALKAGLLSGPVNVTLLGPSGDDTLASFSSRGPRRIFGSPLRLKPDIAAPGVNITSVQTGTTCLVAAGCTGVSDPSGIQVATRSLTISGTSMAAPHMAGIMALLRQLHPDWEVEELKALAMNYAIHDMTLFAGQTPPRFGPSRIGSGRVDPAEAALGEVIAMNAEDEGMVSVAFLPEVVGVVNEAKAVRLVSKCATDETYDLAFDLTNDAPGVDLSLPGGNSVTVLAGGSIEFPVQMTADSNQMDQKRDPALFPTQGVQANYGDQPRSFLTEEEGYLTFSQGGNLKFRLPIYMAEKPSAMMAAADTIVTGGAGTGSTTIALSGADLCTGTLAAGPTCTGTFPTDVVSLVSPFELQVVSPLDPASTLNSDFADIQYAGVSFLPNANGLGAGVNNDLILFGVSSWGDWSTLNEVSYNICVDTNEDGTYDFSVFNLNPAIFVAGASFQDVFHRGIRNLTTNGNTILGLGSFVNLVSPAAVDSALHLNNVMLLGATPAQLGMLAGDTTFRYKVVTCPATNTGCARTTGANDHCSPSPAVRFDEAVGPFFYNWAAPGINFSGNFLDEDLDTNTLSVSWDTANMATNGSVGALLLHHHNAPGKRAEVVLLDTALSANLAITKSVNTPTAAVGTNVNFTVTVTNNGPNTVSSVQVSDLLPAGFSYFADNGAGAYISGTGLWTVPGTIVNGASKTLILVATVTVDSPICNQAMITGGTPLDPDPSDNQATACINGPAAGVSVDPTAGLTTTEAGGTDTFDVVLDSLPSAAVDIDLVSSDTTEGTVATPITFTTANWATPQTVTVTGVNDLLTDGDIAYTIQTGTTSGDPTYDAIDPTDVNVTNNDDASEGTFYTVAPCRLVDTRTGTAFVSAEIRTYDLAACGPIPATARAVSLNITAVDASGNGEFQLFSADAVDGSTPSSVVSFPAGLTRANNAIVDLSDLLDQFKAKAVLTSGSVHLVVDLNGYFE